MEHIRKNINKYSKIAIVICFAIIIFDMNKCYMNLDDEVYSKVFHDFSTFKIWVGEFYNTWSGRIVTSTLSNIFLRMPLIIFRICNTVVYIIAIIAIFKIAKSFKVAKSINENILFASIFIIALLIDQKVIHAGMIWVVGAFNYLWPTAFMCVALIPFIKAINNKKENKAIFIIYIISDFIACFAEQTALVLLCFGAIVILYKLINKQKIDKLLLLHFILIAILTGIELLAPGNFVRTKASTLRRYPTFDMLSIGDKILQGVIIFANQMLGADSILMLILTFLIELNYIKNKEKKIGIKILSIIPFIYFLISFIGAKQGIGEGILYNITLFGKEYIYDKTKYIPVLIFIINQVLISALIFFIFKDIKNGIFAFIIFGASIASVICVSFSPTIYASGARIFFVTDFLILIIIQIMLNNIIFSNQKYLNQEEYDDKIIKGD